jgi:hypothetical protein
VLGRACLARLAAPLASVRLLSVLVQYAAAVLVLMRLFGCCSRPSCPPAPLCFMERKVDSPLLESDQFSFLEIFKNIFKERPKSFEFKTHHCNKCEKIKMNFFKSCLNVYYSYFNVKKK